MDRRMSRWVSGRVLIRPGQLGRLKIALHFQDVLGGPGFVELGLNVREDACVPSIWCWPTPAAQGPISKLGSVMSVRPWSWPRASARRGLR